MRLWDLADRAGPARPPRRPRRRSRQSGGGADALRYNLGPGLAFDPDGRVLVVASGRDRTIRLCNVVTGRVYSTAPVAALGHRRRIPARRRPADRVVPGRHADDLGHLQLAADPHPGLHLGEAYSRRTVPMEVARLQRRRTAWSRLGTRRRAAPCVRSRAIPCGPAGGVQPRWHSAFKLLPLGPGDGGTARRDHPLGFGDGATPLDSGRLPLQPDARSLLQPHGRRLIASNLNGTLVVWDARTGAEALILRPTGRSADMWSTAISPDGRHIAAGDRQGRIHLWSAGSPR